MSESKQAISEHHSQLLSKFNAFPELMLTGGTALAMQIGHRVSYDLDFVIPDEVSDQLITSILQTIEPKQVVQRLQNSTQYTAIFDQIKITVFQDSAPLLHPIVLCEGTKLVNSQDIFATKLYILGKRSEWRDYVDIAFCLKHQQFDLGLGVEEAVKRYKVAKRWILEPLTYFTDLTEVPVEWRGHSMDRIEIETVITEAVKKYLDQ